MSFIRKSPSQLPSGSRQNPRSLTSLRFCFSNDFEGAGYQQLPVNKAWSVQIPPTSFNLQYLRQKQGEIEENIPLHSILVVIGSI